LPKTEPFVQNCSSFFRFTVLVGTIALLDVAIALLDVAIALLDVAIALLDVAIALLDVAIALLDVAIALLDVAIATPTLLRYKGRVRPNICRPRIILITRPYRLFYYQLLLS
jgi:hypothetical protein